jgi:hypothetical protein
MAKLDFENAISDDLETSKFKNFSTQPQPCKILQNVTPKCKYIKSWSQNILHPSKIFWNVHPWTQNFLTSSSPQKKLNLLLKNGSSLKCLKISLPYVQYTYVWKTQSLFTRGQNNENVPVTFWHSAHGNIASIITCHGLPKWVNVYTNARACIFLEFSILIPKRLIFSRM